MFVLGFFLPVFWLIGAMIEPTEAAADRGRWDRPGSDPGLEGGRAPHRPAQL